ncbi:MULTISPECIES: DUF1002 domain-containing protein [Bacillus]|uniref:Exported protein n=1 Tax=Bacillus amyloliquefaciens (strain ATCC 23350 / DSM 7 / BCRC 11601 / CCUG 28519 / NBRC 15535 / NRRL B-14393 / F) TaxID=692420 RepID=A0A9P1NHZ7_BACAS|nr:DUF1002 domain-containing protein [Bacillus amyloliquefaciens]AEB64053.1 hypothetical protein LL3_02520 [Bacillus amyloliquefaciens LL3]ARW39496.1 uncharacterized protein S101267_02409 [Bacillus amyloliquefaciens]AZV89703.1 hypothetical protein BUN12_1443 [Bacillus amyloliquefaciens]KYC95729.1 hypothetical protein B425_2580 [Bacillus amyloliquefaciens]MBW8279234.1 DUF1002 domain-containing protein [Bacillus amyloliquefaciens]
MKKMWIGLLAAAVVLCTIPKISLADAAVGDVIVTLGADLSNADRQKVLDELNVPDNATKVTVTNKEEHEYLGKYISNAQIGTRAISSSSITVEKKGSGLDVQTHNIDSITDEMYLNALMTAGVKDAKVYVTAPFEVSGTAALTGVIKAYEVSSDKAISEDVKQVANQELVTTSKLGDKIGDKNASALIANIKDDFAKNGVPDTKEGIEKKVDDAASNLNITLTDAQKDQLVSLFNKMKNAKIDWGQVGNQLDKAKDKITKFIQSDEGKSFIQKVIDFFASIWNAIVSVFTGDSGSSSNS